MMIQTTHSQTIFKGCLNQKEQGCLTAALSLQCFRAYARLPMSHWAPSHCWPQELQSCRPRPSCPMTNASSLPSHWVWSHSHPRLTQPWANGAKEGKLKTTPLTSLVQGAELQPTLYHPNSPCTLLRADSQGESQDLIGCAQALQSIQEWSLFSSSNSSMSQLERTEVRAKGFGVG